MANPRSAKDVLEKVVKNLGIDKRMQELELMKLWSEVAGEKLAKSTFAHRIHKDKKIVIGVENAALANELQFLKAKLEARYTELSLERLGVPIKGLIFELRNKSSI